MLCLVYRTQRGCRT